ncbi:hypothetical protein [Bdellovibrio sp. HCB288]|uniref:hypothetical protein n=1 Tax=Bdellovibrio sp. HCB288 TaxID=3394355 RepID=UPI0039B3D01D
MNKPMTVVLVAALSFGGVTALLPTFSLAAPTQKSQSGMKGIQLDANAVVPEIVALGIQPQVYKVMPPRLKEQSYEEDQYVLHIILGHLTVDQFEELNSLYGAHSFVQYDSKKNYNLIDFLPRAIQATVNKTFTQTAISGFPLGEVETSEDIKADLWPLQKNGVGFFTNCWGTTIEVLRSLRSDDVVIPYTLSWPSRETADEYFKDDIYSSKTKESALQFGDVLVVSQKSGTDVVIQHTAFIINKSVVFEKTDTMDDDPYRLSLRADVLSKYKRIFEGDEVFKYRHFSSDKEVIPTQNALNPNTFFIPEALRILLQTLPEIPINNLTMGCEIGFGGGCDLTTTEIHVINVVTNPQTGLGTLSGDPKVLKHFRPL